MNGKDEKPTAPIDVQLRRYAGSVIAQIGTHTVARDHSALSAVRACAAKHYGVPESRIDIDIDGPCITASLKLANAGGAR